MSQRFSILLIALVLAMGVSGCGDSNDRTPPMAAQQASPPPVAAPSSPASKPIIALVMKTLTNPYVSERHSAAGS